MKIKKISILLCLIVLLVGCSSKEVVDMYLEKDVYTVLSNDNPFEMTDIKTEIWLENLNPDDDATLIYIKPTITATNENIDYELLKYMEVVFNDTTLGNIKIEKLIADNPKGTIEKGKSITPLIVGLIPMELTEEQMLDVGRVVYAMNLEGLKTYCSLTDVDLVKHQGELEKDTVNSKLDIIQTIKESK